MKKISLALTLGLLFSAANYSQAESTSENDTVLQEQRDAAQYMNETQEEMNAASNNESLLEKAEDKVMDAGEDIKEGAENMGDKAKNLFQKTTSWLNNHILKPIKGFFKK